MNATTTPPPTGALTPGGHRAVRLRESNALVLVATVPRVEWDTACFSGLALTACQCSAISQGQPMERPTPTQPIWHSTTSLGGSTRGEGGLAGAPQKAVSSVYQEGGSGSRPPVLRPCGPGEATKNIMAGIWPGGCHDGSKPTPIPRTPAAKGPSLRGQGWTRVERGCCDNHSPFKIVVHKMKKFPVFHDNFPNCTPQGVPQVPLLGLLGPSRDPAL